MEWSMGRSAALLVLLGAARAAAQAPTTVDATLTTMVAARQDPRDGTIYTVVPIYELLTLSVGGIRARYLDELRIDVSGWGELALGDPREGLATGDLDLGYLDAALFGRRVAVRLGRQLVVSGGARALQLDGASLTVRIARGVGVTAWGGAPVRPRFGTRLGDTAAGGRIFWRRGFDTEVGLSFVHVLDGGRVAREDLGADARWQPLRGLAVSGYALLSLVELRLAEATAAITWQPHRMVEVRADYRRTAPDLFLPRSSILSVFSEETRDEAGGSVYVRPHRRVRLNADYHAIVDLTGVGHDGGAKTNVYLGTGFETSIGAELRALHLPDKGYLRARLYAIQRLRPGLTLTLDADAYRLEQAINAQNFSFTGAASLGWDVKPGWRVLVSGAGDVTPFVRQRFECMAKLVYNHAFHVHEVRR
jgi:hypothetical protein